MRKIPSGAILITTEPGSMIQVAEKIKKIDKVGRMEMLTGPYDVIAIIEDVEMEKLASTLVEKIRNIDGVKETTTNIFLKTE